MLYHTEIKFVALSLQGCLSFTCIYFRPMPGFRNPDILSNWRLVGEVCAQCQVPVLLLWPWHWRVALPAFTDLCRWVAPLLQIENRGLGYERTAPVFINILMHKLQSPYFPILFLQALKMNLYVICFLTL